MGATGKDPTTSFPPIFEHRGSAAAVEDTVDRLVRGASFIGYGRVRPRGP
jgi:hypothetical protein